MTFRSPIYIRIPAWPKATGESFGSPNALLTPNPAQPFIQSDWPRPNNPKWKAIGDVDGTHNALLTPNPANPFNQYEWRSASPPRPPLKSDVYSGVAPILTPNPAQPFQQNLWEGERPLPKAIGEALGGDAPLLTPNPAQPFSQNLWENAASGQKAKVDDFVNIPAAPVVVTPPFFQNLWDNPARIFPKAVGEAIAGPNPQQPFIQSDWLRAPFAQKAKVDDVADLLSLYSPNPAQPFIQDDWPAPHGRILSDRGFIAFNSNPPAPVVQTGIVMAGLFGGVATFSREGNTPARN